MFRRPPRIDRPRPRVRLRRAAATAARSVKVGIAVGVTVLALPFDARAEESSIEASPTMRFVDANDSPAEPTDADAADHATLLHACPIDGDSTFENSWGWARSGGRRHRGVDMIADSGTPIAAVRDGYAQFKRSGLGGRAVWLTTDDGDEFYYAHLSDWEGESRDVTAGEIIGYVGSSGNARGPHLHFETLPDGNAENPYPHTLRACVPPPATVVNQIAQQNASASISTRRSVWGPSPESTAVLRSALSTSAHFDPGGTFRA